MTSNTADSHPLGHVDFYTGRWHPSEMSDKDPIPEEYRHLASPPQPEATPPASVYTHSSATLDNRSVKSRSVNNETFIHEEENTQSPENGSIPFENTSKGSFDIASTIPYEKLVNETIENGVIPDQNIYYLPPENGFIQDEGMYNPSPENGFSPYGSLNIESPKSGHISDDSYNIAPLTCPASSEGTPTYEEVYQTIKQDVLDASESDVDTIVYGPIKPDMGYQMACAIANDINDIDNMKTHVHYDSLTQRFEISKQTSISDTIGEWFSRVIRGLYLHGKLTVSEFRQLMILEGEWTDGFTYPYYLSAKQPAIQVRTPDQKMPRIVFEIGWKESIDRMYNDVDLWGYGSYPNVQVVILVQWTLHLDNRVEGAIMVYRPQVDQIEVDGAVEFYRKGMQLVQIESIFPKPLSGRREKKICLNRGELFGNALVPGRDPTEVFEFYLNELQDLAEANIRECGLLPAEYDNEEMGLDFGFGEN
ncbi:uncharacterized protein KD926_002606 [Aspergillus affinis]|uniref:uncharacterized protein n=1 Tax=Aspergillus affinis TaxID=1070780 RepID=UPI0022FDBB54|nr:uncharacterized protein KD926_002606 [Aspergillus affinis]KAI9035941.1 hypothetical protein KD926_002606 [Aspergillus affinis]